MDAEIAILSDELDRHDLVRLRLLAAHLNFSEIVLVFNCFLLLVNVVNHDLAHCHENIVDQVEARLKSESSRLLELLRTVHALEVFITLLPAAVGVEV